MWKEEKLFIPMEPCKSLFLAMFLSPWVLPGSFHPVAAARHKEEEEEEQPFHTLRCVHGGSFSQTPPLEEVLSSWRGCSPGNPDA